MKLVTSTGDFSWYVDSVTEKIKAFKDTKFKYINLEQTGSIPAFFSENDDDWRRLADDWGNAAAYAGVEFVVSHAPCLNVFQDFKEETYRNNLRAIRRSIEICHILDIKRIVVHASPKDQFSAIEFYEKNRRFYRDLFDLMEKYEIMVLTENWDNSEAYIATGKELRSLVEFIDHPLMGVCWDTAHANFTPKARALGQYQNIIDISDKLKGVHISDNFGDTHHHSWPFAGIINFDSVMQGLLDVKYDSYFTFEASYSLLHQNNLPYRRKPWEHRGETITKLLNPSIELKKQAVDLLYETGKYILESYDCFEE